MFADEPKTLGEAQFQYFRDAGDMISRKKRKCDQDILINDAKLNAFAAEQHMLDARTKKYEWQSKLFQLQYDRYFPLNIFVRNADKFHFCIILVNYSAKLSPNIFKHFIKLKRLPHVEKNTANFIKIHVVCV